MSINKSASGNRIPEGCRTTLLLALQGSRPATYALITTFFLSVVPLTVLAQTPAALQDCHALANAGERLDCYDRVSGRAAGLSELNRDLSPAQAGTESPSADVSAFPGEESSILEAAWRLRPDSDRYPIGMYHANYILPLRYTNDTNNRPFSPIFDAAEIPDQQLDSAESKFQLSLKARVWATDDRRWGLWLAYTQQNQWQVFNEEISRPFRETNYMPEIFATYNPDLQFAGLDWKLLSFGLNHQSNGRADPISRSWDRLFAEFGVERGNLAVMLRLWTRIEESEEDDDNPDITDYYGHSEINALYRRGGHSFALMTRGNLDTGKGAVQAGWFSPPLFGPMRGYIQVFSGYGESMIDYNWNQTTVGIGIALNDGL